MSSEDKLIELVTSITFDDLPSEVIGAVKKSILDSLGVSIAGSNTLVARKLASLVKEWGGKPESTVFLNDFRVPAHEAAFLNSTMARSVDFDQYHIQTGSHPMPTMVPVALATAELCEKTNGKEFITAVVVGSEVSIRMRLVPDFCVGLSGWAGELHAAFGGAVTAGRILGLSPDELRNALGLAYSQAAGNFQAFVDGTLAFPLQQGFSSRVGVLSARLAESGLTGGRNFLEGRCGFYPVYYRGIDYDIQRLLGGFGETYEVLNLASKPYPSTGFTNGPIQNVLEIMRQHDLSSEDIDTVVLRIGQRMFNNTCRPKEVKYRPKTVTDAIFSLPYTVGTALFKGDVFLEDFSPEAINEAARLLEVDKVEVISDPDIEEEVIKLNLPLSLNVAEIKTKDHRSLSQKRLHAKGFPQDPMTIDECAEKAKRCARFAVKEFTGHKVDRLVDMIASLDQIEDVSSLTEILH